MPQMVHFVCICNLLGSHHIRSHYFWQPGGGLSSLKQMWSNPTGNHEFQIVDYVQVSTCVHCNILVDDQKSHTGDGLPLCVYICGL
jgi:hypothetical protein